MPVMARNIVATGQPLAAQVGLDMLERGGTAADAAVAVAAALTVVEPTANGLGSDAFALTWDGTHLHGLNASGCTPRALDVERLCRSGIPRLGWDAVTMPGAVSGWVALWRAHGRLPFADLLAPAVALARDGFPVSPQCATGWARAATRYAEFPAWVDTFTRDGRTPRIGEHWTLPDHAATLEAIARTEGEAFYRGEIADRIADAATTGGGAIRREDLEAHAPVDVDPLSVPFLDVELHELPPNGQGLAALVAAGVLERFDPAAFDPDDPSLLHLQIEAMKVGFADAGEHVADPAFMHCDPASLVTAEALDDRAMRVNRESASNLCDDVPQWSSTVYLCCADAGGMAVSFIQSNYEGFGSGIVIPGTGIAMHNRGAGFVTDPDHPNVIAPGKRPYHTIIPGFTTKDGAPHMAFGVMGGPMQPQGHLQVLSRVVAGRQDPQSALDAPRWRFEGARRVAVEPDMPATTVDALRAWGHDVHVATSRDVSFGGGQAVVRVEDCWCGASDGRRDGQAVGR